MNPTLSIEGVSKRYKDKTALHPCTIRAKAGDCIVLCGGNGAGKSTLIGILTGTILPNEGSVSIGEVNLEQEKKKYLKKIGYMPDDFNAQKELTVREFLSFYGAVRRVSSSRVDEVLELIGLSGSDSRLRVKSLSKGMHQRLILGQAILSDPEVLIMDEPTNGLDPFWVNRFVELVKELKQQGSIILFSTHMMDVAAELGTSIYFMSEGKNVETLTSSTTVESNTKRLLQLHRT